MAYVAVTGGSQAIEASLKLLTYYRSGGEEDLALETLRDNLSLLVERAMGEAGFYARDYAALALKQCEGNLDEAVFLLRAYRSTLPRTHYALPLHTPRLIRRISAAFKDIPGGQMLGPAYDYTHRLMDFGLAQKNESPQALREEMLSESTPVEVPYYEAGVSQQLMEQGLIQPELSTEPEPFDVTQHMLTFPAPRSARLQTLARADTGFVDGLAYSSLRGYGLVHPTVGELRVGYFAVEIEDPLSPGDSLYLGELLITECESYIPREKAGGDGVDRLLIDVGYGAVYGRCETKAIAMSILDRSLELGGDTPTGDEEFVLMHGDSLEMNGFISHLKLPHYVTFQSKLDRMRENAKRRQSDDDQ